MLWLGNSPNLNAIEKAWSYMKKETTKRGPTTNRKELRARWEKYWQDLPQSKIQEWIEVIPHHVKEIIRLKGGNEYKQGRKKGEEKVTDILDLEVFVYTSEFIKPYFRGPLQGLQGTRNSFREIKVRPYRPFSGLHKIYY